MSSCGCRGAEHECKIIPKSCPLTRVRTPPQVFRKIQCPSLVAQFGAEHFHFRSKKERSNLIWSLEFVSSVLQILFRIFPQELSMLVEMVQGERMDFKLVYLGNIQFGTKFIMHLRAF